MLCYYLIYIYYFLFFFISCAAEVKASQLKHRFGSLQFKLLKNQTWDPRIGLKIRISFIHCFDWTRRCRGNADAEAAVGKQAAGLNKKKRKAKTSPSI